MLPESLGKLNGLSIYLAKKKKRIFQSNMTGINDSSNYFSSHFSLSERVRWIELLNKILDTAIYLSTVKNNDWLPLAELGQCV